MKESQLRKLLEESVETYINNIAKELEEPHDQWFDNFGFPIFGETSKEYHEQVYFQSYLESYTRKMINHILLEMCSQDCSDEITCPEFKFLGVYNGYTNTECEQEFGFELINQHQKIGYRYTDLQLDEIDNLLTKGGVNTIAQVIWQKDDDPVWFHYDDPRVRVILLWDLFQELFCEFEEEEIRLMYDLFTDYVSKAVTQANSMISLVTLPGFTPSYIYRTRNEVLNDLKRKVRTLSSFFVKNENYKSTEENSKQLIENYKLSSYFLEHRMVRVFVGRAKYAKSFLTSEYLYRYFKNNPMFDYTPIVSGYIKSIEQLLDAICVNYRNAQRIQLDMRDYTMGSYTVFLNNHELMLREALRPMKEIIVKCLESYRIESRNHLFHKDYFDAWERVEYIRENTIFLFVTLLGSVDTTLFAFNPAILGYLNDEYDRLFHLLDSRNERQYTLILKGKEFTDMDKQRRDKGLIFNQNGQIQNTIRFRKFVYDHYEELEISWRNMPSEIWIAETCNKKSKKIWPPVDDELTEEGEDL